MMVQSLKLWLTVFLGLLFCSNYVEAKHEGTISSLGDWTEGQASFSSGGANSGLGTGPSCGYGSEYTDGFGTLRVAASQALWSEGLICGACYEVKCDSKSFPGCGAATSVNVTVTDLCKIRAVKSKSGEETVTLCSSRSRSLILAKQAFARIASTPSVVVPVIYRRVSCQRTGAMTFKVGGNPLYFEVNIRNVAGAGAIGKVWIKAKGIKTWLPMEHLWGQNWGMSAKLIGKAISFKIFTPVTNKYAIAWKVVPTSWQPGGLYSGGQFQ